MNKQIMKYTEEKLRALKDNDLFNVSEKLSIYGKDFFIEIKSKMLLKNREAKENLIKEILNKQNNMKANNNPWISGSFYLTTILVIIVLLAVLSKIIHWTILPITIIAGILIVGLIGILQLKNDDKISDKTFMSLLTETYKRLTLIGKRKK